MNFKMKQKKTTAIKIWWKIFRPNDVNRKEESKVKITTPKNKGAKNNIGAKDQLNQRYELPPGKKIEINKKELVATKSDMSTRKYLKLKTRLIVSYWI